ALIPLGVRAAERRQRVAAALDSVALGDRARHLPGEMSGGQQQRVAVARALVKEPTVLLADEPTGNLDEDTRDEIINLLEKLWRERGLTLVLVTHDTAIARRAQRVGVMSKGLLTIQAGARPAPASDLVTGEGAGFGPVAAPLPASAVAGPSAAGMAGLLTAVPASAGATAPSRGPGGPAGPGGAVSRHNSLQITWPAPAAGMASNAATKPPNSPPIQLPIDAATRIETSTRSGLMITALLITIGLSTACAKWLESGRATR